MIAEGFDDFQPIFCEVVSGKSLLDGFIDVFDDSDVSDAVRPGVDVAAFASLPGYIYNRGYNKLIFLRLFTNYWKPQEMLQNNRSKNTHTKRVKK